MANPSATIASSSSPAAAPKEPKVATFLKRGRYAGKTCSFDVPEGANPDLFLPFGYECQSGSILQLTSVKGTRSSNKLIAQAHQDAMKGTEPNPADGPRKGRQLLEIGWILAQVEVLTGEVFDSFNEYMDSITE